MPAARFCLSACGGVEILDMINISPDNTIEEWTDVIPHAGHLADDYLRQVANNVVEVGPPVRLELDKIVSGGGFRQTTRVCLVVEPTHPKLKRFKSAHFAYAVGTNLSVGWHFVGAEYAGGLLGAYGNIMGPNDAQVQEVNAIMQIVHQGAVMPAAEEIFRRAQINSGPGSFFGA